ncbi:hypothetical protein CYY_002866 [Polysphondylium violaceum]|uniref:Rab GTPase n=1 Tax=Polysphondylium violaceum TaxID=133409 RepID=A0A8J4PZG7_9MYCE|nr:hypothetical protein CYY_002866 [Polysphondylium violaceum]
MSYLRNYPQVIVPVKIVIIGTANAGKTSLALRLVKDTFQNESLPTVGAMFLNKFFAFDNYTIKFEIWDTAGQEKFHSLANMYFRGSKIAVVVFDLSDTDSFNKAKIWTREFKTNSNPEEPAIMALVGNKCDLNKATPQSEIDAYVEQEGMLYFEASAKENTNVNNIFRTLADKIPAPQLKQQQQQQQDTIDINKNNKKKKCC